MARLQDDVEQFRTERVSPVTVLDISLPSPSTAASILNPAATCFSPTCMLLESGDLSPCRPLSVNSMDTTNAEHADTTDTESVGDGLWAVAVMSSPAVEAAAVRTQRTLTDPETRDSVHCTGVECANITSAASAWRVVDIIATNG